MVKALASQPPRCGFKTPFGYIQEGTPCAHLGVHIHRALALEHSSASSSWGGSPEEEVPSPVASSSLRHSSEWCIIRWPWVMPMRALARWYVALARPCYMANIWKGKACPPTCVGPFGSWKKKKKRIRGVYAFLDQEGQLV